MSGVSFMRLNGSMVSVSRCWVMVARSRMVLLVGRSTGSFISVAMSGSADRDGEKKGRVKW